MSRRKVSFSTKIGYGLGANVYAVKDASFNTFLLFYYTQVLGLSGSLAGIALLVSLFIDALTDPVLGYVSDNSNSRFGRRHFFMMVATIPLAASFYALFSPMSGLGQTGLFLWMTACVTILRFMLTIYNIPYLTLGAEITTDYVERSTISTYRTVIGWLGGVVMVITAFATFFRTTPEFTTGQMNPAGYSNFGLFCGVIVIIMASVCISMTFKEIPFLPKASDNGKQVGIKNFIAELKMALKNGSLRLVFLIAITSSAMYGIGANINLYVNTYYWELKSEHLSVLTTGMILAAVISFSLMRWLKKFEKKKLYFTLCMMSVFNYSIIFLRLFDLVPPNGSPLLFGLVYLQTMYTIIMAILLMILIASILADTVDEGELINNVRQEGIYFALHGFSVKAASGIGVMVAGLAVDFINIPAKAEPGTVDPAVIQNLGIFVSVILGIMGILPGLIMLKMPLTRKRVDEIKNELQKRRENTLNQTETVTG